MNIGNISKVVLILYKYWVYIENIFYETPILVLFVLQLLNIFSIFGKSHHHNIETILLPVNATFAQYSAKNVAHSGLQLWQ